ncbi:MAG TPA: hypothetical protein VGL53_06080 [Bryobacteraceae bacterium]|jgi:hypothetical protein
MGTPVEVTQTTFKKLQAATDALPAPFLWETLTTCRINVASDGDVLADWVEGQ